jgi:CO/xanthine dehydrogenase Mo-binding subunit
MTGLLHEKEFSRTSFVKGGGALIVGFSLAGAGLAGRAEAAIDPFASNGPGDMSAVDTWIVINADNTASIKTGGIRQGTGSDTGLVQIAAEELDMDMGQILFLGDDTNVTPDTGVKAASNTIVGGAGSGIRAAAASARQTLVGLASTKLGVPVGTLSVSKGVVSGAGKSVTYGQLLGGKLFNVEMPTSYNLQNANQFFVPVGLPPGVAPAKPVASYTIVGGSPPRIDIPEIVTGAFTYIQNVHVPGMLHGRVVRPRGQRVYGFGAPIVSVDPSSIKHIPNVQVVRKKNFLGVVAPQEYDAIQAAALLKVKWADPPKTLPGSGNEFKGMRALDKAGKMNFGNADLYGNAPDRGNVDRALASAAHTVTASFGWPTNCHTPIGPMCMLADVTPHGARVFAGTQGTYITRQKVAEVTGLPLDRVRVTGVAMGGCFGNGCQYNDVAQAAALMSQSVRAPVRVQWMRWDEIGWDNNAPGTLMDVRAGADAKGNLVAFDFTQFYPEYMSELRETSAELAGYPIPQPSTSVSGNFWTVPMYNIPNTRYLVKSIPLQGNWIKNDWMRAGSSPHTQFASEQVIDELAHAAGMDPVAFRRQNIVQDASGANSQQPLLAVLDAATKAANWRPKVAASNLSDANVVTGRGVALTNAYGPADQAAAVVDIEVNKTTGKITVKHIYCAYAAGLLVNPGLVENQIVGGNVQITSRVLWEQLTYSNTNVTSMDFITYPLLRFKDSPKVTAIAVQNKALPPGPVGEPPTQPAPAAIANAFFDATGVRMRTAPMTPARVRAVLAAKGQGTAGL